jgi:hypothetical protein
LPLGDTSNVKATLRPNMYGRKTISFVIGHSKYDFLEIYIDNDLARRSKRKFETKVAVSNGMLTSCYTSICIYSFKHDIIFEIMSMK